MDEYDDILPSTGLPATHCPANGVFAWFDYDTPETFDANGRPDPYGEHDITYRFNAQGYRAPDFDQSADIRVVAIGCSYVMGIGLPQSALFHERFAERLRAQTGRSVVVWNLGLSGASNDYINRILQLAVPYLDPAIVLVNFTHASRREYVSVEDRLVGYNPGWCPTDRVERQIHDHFKALSSSFDDRLNLFRNYRAIASLLSDRCWLFSTIDPWTLNEIMDHVDTSRYVGNLETIDIARDQEHPGPGSHAALARHYWNRYLALRPEMATPTARDSVAAPSALTTTTSARPGPLAADSRQTTNRARPFDWMAKRVGLLRYVKYRLRRSAQIRKAKERDSNIYPLW